jgi:putative FmdB family regulatory protein
MPLYDYVPKSGSCDDCGGRFTELQKISDKPLGFCPTCNKPCEKVVALVAEPAGVRGNYKAGHTAALKSAKADSRTRAKSGGHNHNCAAVGCGKKRS